jgi:hypothetical protein
MITLGFPAPTPKQAIPRLLGSVAIAAVLSSTALANGLHVVQGISDPPTRLERFLRDDCTTCVRGSYPVGSIPLSPLKLMGFSPPVTNLMTRSGEVRFEIVRAYPLDRTTQQYFGLRASLWIASGGGQLYRLAVGLVDDQDLALLATAVAEITRAAESAKTDADTLEIEVHMGSLRIGALRTSDAVVGYMQLGDVHALAPPSTLDAQNTLFMSLTDLSTVGKAIAEANARIGALRTR